MKSAKQSVSFPEGERCYPCVRYDCHLCLGPPAYLQLTAGLPAKVGFANINAKAEGIESKPAFREAFQRRRCLVPVDNFYA